MRLKVLEYILYQWGPAASGTSPAHDGPDKLCKSVHISWMTTMKFLALLSKMKPIGCVRNQLLLPPLSQTLIKIQSFLNAHIQLLGEPFFPKILPNFGAKRQKIPEQPFFQSVAVGYLQDNLQMIFSNNLHFSKSVQCEFSWNGMQSS